MNRLTVGILLSFTVILSVTALNYTPDPLSSTSNCQYKSACVQSGQACGKKTFNKRCGKTVCANNKQNCSIGSNCTKPCCAQKAKACGSDCTKPCCAQKAKACGSDCTKPCCAQKAKACGPDCTKPCCAEKKGI